MKTPCGAFRLFRAREATSLMYAIIINLKCESSYFRPLNCVKICPYKPICKPSKKSKTNIQTYS